MVTVIESEENRRLSLQDYAADAKFVTAVSDLRAQVARLAPRLAGRTVWMVNSAARGGGVAEMLPRLCAFLNELGIAVRWAVIGTDRPGFFVLTKRIHNLIHGDSSAGTQLGPEEARLYEAVSRENAESLRRHLGPADILVVHDPQPAGVGALLGRQLGLKTVWRCHIGIDSQNAATRAAWDFLSPYLDGYDQAIFSAPEYIPAFLAGRAMVVHPSIDPLSHKNRDLLVKKMVGILCDSGLQKAHEPVPEQPFEHQVRRVTQDGGSVIPGEMGLLFRPVVLQVSRWDRLKGWAPLLEAFVRMKQAHAAGADACLDQRNRRRIELSRLVLAGPDPAGVADDPEGQEVFAELSGRYGALPPALAADVALLNLPMQSRKENALIVNALQRCASVVVQNSIQEGFGLTVTEAMWKRLCVLGSSACGIRQQIRDGVDGRLTQNPEDPDEIATHLRALLCEPNLRYQLGRAAQLRAFSEFLIFRQVSRYAELLARLAGSAAARAAG